MNATEIFTATPSCATRTTTSSCSSTTSTSGSTRNHFAEFWLPELRAGGVNVQVLPICLEDQFQSEGGLRRTLLLVERMHRLAAEHPDDVAICVTGAEVDAAVAAGRIACILALEGAHGIGQDPDLIRTMSRVGVRVVSMAHLDRTFLADGSGLDTSSRSRLTPQGIAVFEEMERLGIVFDISHLGIGGVDNVLEIARRPFLATHSACLGITDIHRNLGDEQIKAIAELGGVIGVAAAIPFFIDLDEPERRSRRRSHRARHRDGRHRPRRSRTRLRRRLLPAGLRRLDACRPTSASTMAHAEVSRPSDLPKITEAMVRRGFEEDDIRKILGGNVLRVLREVMGVPA